MNDQLEQLKASLKGSLLNKFLVLIVCSAILPVANYMLKIWSINDSIVGFAINLLIILIPAATLMFFLQKKSVQENFDLAKLIAVSMAYVSLIVFCVINATVFLDVGSIFLDKLGFFEVSTIYMAISTVLRWSMALLMIWGLVFILVSSFKQLIFLDGIRKEKSRTNRC